MAEKIVAAVRLKRRVLEGVQQQDDIIALLQQYTRASLFSAPNARTAAMRRDIVALVREKYIALADSSGRVSAVPLLESLGITPSKRLSGAPLKFLSSYKQANLKWFAQEVTTATDSLSSELKTELARAARDGVARRRMQRQVIRSYNAELKQLKKARKGLAAANKALANAEATGDLKAIKAARKARSAARGATTRVTTAMGRVENKVQGAARDAVRREAQRAQLAQYRQEGFRVFTWVAVNGSAACPDCTGLHGDTRTMAQWQGQQPGDGHTVCGDACMCELVPDEYAEGNESLKEPVNPFLFDELK